MSEPEIKQPKLIGSREGYVKLSWDAAMQLQLEIVSLDFTGGNKWPIDALKAVITELQRKLEEVENKQAKVKLDTVKIDTAYIKYPTVPESFAAWYQPYA